MCEMPFHHLVVQKRGAAIVARLEDFSPYDDGAVQQIGNELCQLAKNGTTILVVDFSSVDFFEANLRGQLARLSKALNSLGGRHAVCHLPPGMKEYFIMIHLDRLMLLADTLEEALGALDTEENAQIP